MSFEEQVNLVQFLLPPICFGILLGGFILYVYMYWRYKNSLYFAVAFFAFLGMLFVGSETMILSFGGWLHNRTISVHFHRLEQVSGLFYLFALPYSLNKLLILNKRWHSINILLAYIGLAYAVITTLCAYLFPDLFISLTTPKITWMHYEADYGRGQEGILYAIRDVLLGFYIVYATVLVVVDMVGQRNYKYLLFPSLGFFFAFAGAAVDTLHVHTHVFYDFFPNVYFSRFSLGITLAIVFFMSSVTRMFITYAQELEIAHKIISISEKKYRFLVEGTNDCILSFDSDLKITTANKASYEQLEIRKGHESSITLYDLLYLPEGESDLTLHIIKQKINMLVTEGMPLSLRILLKSRGTREPKEYNIRMEHITIDDRNEILMKASSVMDENMLKYIEAEKMRLSIGNYLIAAEEICNRLVLNLPKYVDKSTTNVIKLGLREIIINAIEHGNLNISFEEKTKATAEGNYLEFVLSRQKDPNYKDKKVTIEFLLNCDKVIYKIEDEGNGFNYREIIQKIQNTVDEEMLGHGRGLRMVYKIFDEVKFNRKGNQVLLVKNFFKD
ncbi:MAG: ATP-binding protein [Spirochaetota bacterium]